MRTNRLLLDEDAQTEAIELPYMSRQQFIIRFFLHPKQVNDTYRRMFWEIEQCEWSEDQAKFGQLLLHIMETNVIETVDFETKDKY